MNYPKYKTVNFTLSKRQQDVYELAISHGLNKAPDDPYIYRLYFAKQK